MKCAALFIVAALDALPAAASPAPIAMTGSMLLELITFPPDVHSTFDLSPGQYLDLERGYKYLDGVRGATAGKSWCYSKQYPAKPDTMYGAAIDGLKQLPAAQLKRKAADLIVDIWSKRWPCGARRARGKGISIWYPSRIGARWNAARIVTGTPAKYGSGRCVSGAKRGVREVAGTGS